MELESFSNIYLKTISFIFFIGFSTFIITNARDYLCFLLFILIFSFHYMLYDVIKELAYVQFYIQYQNIDDNQLIYL
jgi:hypothetical protein